MRAKGLTGSCLVIAILAGCGEQAPVANRPEPANGAGQPRAPVALPANLGREAVVDAYRCHGLLSAFRAVRAAQESEAADPELARIDTRMTMRWLTFANRAARQVGMSDREEGDLIASSVILLATPEARAREAQAARDCIRRTP